MVLLPSIRSIPTASVSWYRHRIQSFNGCCVTLYLVSNIGAALVEFVLWEFRNSPLATHPYSFVIYLWSSRSVNQYRRLSVEQLGCSLVWFDVWSSGQSLPAPNTLFALFFVKLFVKLLLAIDCEQTRRIDRINQYNVEWHLTLISYTD